MIDLASEAFEVAIDESRVYNAVGIAIERHLSTLLIARSALCSEVVNVPTLTLRRGAPLFGAELTEFVSESSAFGRNSVPNVQVDIGAAMPHGGFDGSTPGDLALAEELARFMDRHHR